MTNQAWNSSKKFLLLRLINQMSHNMKQELQRIYDVADLLNAEYEGGLDVYDKFNLFTRQLKIVGSELDELIGDGTKLNHILSPKSFDEKKETSDGFRISTQAFDES